VAGALSRGAAFLLAHAFVEPFVAVALLLHMSSLPCSWLSVALAGRRSSRPGGGGGGGSGGFGGGGGRGSSARDGGGDGHRKEKKTAEQLDDEMDLYLAARDGKDVDEVKAAIKARKADEAKAKLDSAMVRWRYHRSFSSAFVRLGRAVSDGGKVLSGCCRRLGDVK